MYPSDLTDAQWAVLEPLLLSDRVGRHAGGRPRKYPLRRVVDALLYVAKTGCQWRQLPENFPPWLSCHQQFRVWRDSGVWERINAELVSRSRRRQGRDWTPTMAIIDSQSAKNGAKRGQRGFDAGKKIKGRKRHIAVDRDGHLLAAVVHSAGVQDSAGAFPLLTLLRERVATVRTVFADGGYQGKLLAWAKETLGISMEIVKRNHDKGFQVLRKRWVVERSFAWFGWNRRLSKDYELNPKSAECFLFIAATHLLLKRL